jgi:fructuronate reductase
VGAIVTDEVAGFERAKLRILNGAHSTLAYAGLLRGHVSVADAVADAELAAFVAAMIREEIIPTLPALPGFDLHDYAAAVLRRFRNPAIVHRLDQIAQDGSQKLPYRLGDTLFERRRAGAPVRRVAAAIGCWIAFLITRARAGAPIIDPLAPVLAAAVASGNPAEVWMCLAGNGLPLAPELMQDDSVRTKVTATTIAALAGKWDAVLAG